MHPFFIHLPFKGYESAGSVHYGFDRIDDIMDGCNASDICLIRNFMLENLAQPFLTQEAFQFPLMHISL